MNRKLDIARTISVIMPKIARALTARIVHTNELPPTQLFTILALQERGRCHFSDICRDLRVSAPTVTGIIDRLEKKGFAQRIPDTHDRRATNVVLTKKGSAVAKEIRESIVSRWREILENLPIADCEQYLRIVKRINDNIEAGDSIDGGGS